jgi:hypothetical protein
LELRKFLTYIGFKCLYIITTRTRIYLYRFILVCLVKKEDNTMENFNNVTVNEVNGGVADTGAKHEQAVYLASDVQHALGLGKTKTYEYLRMVYQTQKPFRVIKIGKVFRIPKYSFDQWLYSDSREVN